MTTFNDDNGSQGNVFDVKALQALTVTEMDANASASGSASVTVFTKPGVYSGFENNSGAWTSILSASVTSQGRGNPTPLPVYAGVEVASGATQAFFVIVTNIRYTNGSSLGSVFAQNSHIQFLGGPGLSGSFGSAIYSPRMWNGAIRYILDNAGPITPAPVTPAPVTPAPVTFAPGFQDALDKLEQAIGILEAL